MRTLLLIAAVLTAPQAAFSADTLVLCPPTWQPVLAEWLTMREQQGHTVAVETPRPTARENRTVIAEAAQDDALRWVVLVGDVAAAGAPPCDYKPLEIIRRWGPDKTVATDASYADTGGDAAPELAVGRIPVSSAEELRNYLRRVIDYETRGARADAAQRLSVVAAQGNFSPWLDRVLEATATRVLTETTPSDVELDVIYASPGSQHYPGAEHLHEAVLRSLTRPAAAWVYMGHGLPYGLDVAESDQGLRPLLDVASLSHESANPSPPVAAMLACYTGAIDARRPCLAEAMVASHNGPLAVIAASRVTMPYGNSILGLELLHGLFKSPNADNARQSIGGLAVHAKQRAIADKTDLELRATLEQIAAGLTPIDDRRQERLEHVWAYNVLGDPLLTLQQTGPLRTASVPPTTQKNGPPTQGQRAVLK